jgi:hypothetical protein
MAVLGGKLEARRADCAPLADKSTLNRLELSRPEPTRYHKISYDAAAKLRRAMVKHRGREDCRARLPGLRKEGSVGPVSHQGLGPAPPANTAV